MTQVLEQAHTRVSDRSQDLSELQARLKAISHDLETARQARDFDRAAHLESDRSALTALCADARASLEQAQADLSDLERQARDLEHRQEIARAKALEEQAGEAYRTAFTEIVKAVDGGIPHLASLMDDWQVAAQAHHATRQKNAGPKAPEPFVLHGYRREFTPPSAVTVANGSGVFGALIARELEGRSVRDAETKFRVNRETQRLENAARNK